MRVDNMMPNVGEQVMVCGNMLYQVVPESDIPKNEQIAVEFKANSSKVDQ